MYWQISVTIMSFGDHGGSERNGSQNLCGYLWLTTICALASRWQSEMVPSRVYYVTENVENFQSKCYHFTAPKTSETVSVKQYEHDRVTRCTFSVDFKEIKTISQSLPSTCAICFTTAAKRPSQRRDWNASAIWNHEFSNTNLEIFFLKMYGIPDKHLWNDI